MKYILIFFLQFSFLFGVEVALKQNITDNNTTLLKLAKNSEVFGANLFLGKFANINKYRFNPEYRINIGDTIVTMFWGAYNTELKLSVDNQGNIFIPQVGIIHLLGVKAGELNAHIQTAVKKVFKNNVSVYANVANYQPITVFVTGDLVKPGLYEGLGSDSILQFLDKAKGIDLDNGSFRNITILRESHVVKKVDLYDFLLGGSLVQFQFRNGDVIFVDSLKNYVYVGGDVKRVKRFELKGKEITLQKLIEFSVPNKSATSVIIEHLTLDGTLTRNKVNIVNKEYKIFSGDRVVFVSEHNAKEITVYLDGEIEGSHTLIVKKGTSLGELVKKIPFSPLAQKDSVQLYRKSIAKMQKQLIDAQLNDLQTRVLATSSVTTGGAKIRQAESNMVLQFIQKAKKVQPKGRVFLSKDSNLSKVVLEEGDILYIPKRSAIVTIQGEVKLPGAQTFVKGFSIDQYIEAVGSFSERADKEHVLLLRVDGEVLSYNADSFFSEEPTVKPGDSILVLGKTNSENLQITKDITEIVYHIAVSAGVVIGLF